MPRKKPVKKSNGLGSIYFDSAKQRYVAAVTLEVVDGKAKRRKVTARTQEELEVKLADLRKAIAASPKLPTGPTVAQYLDYWLTDVLPLTDTSKGTHLNYASVVRLYIVPNIGSIRLDALTPANVRDMILAVRDSGKSPSTQRLARSVLRRAIRTAEVDGLVTRNVAALVDGVKQRPSTKRTMTPEQARQFLAVAAQYPEADVFRLMLLTGLRRGEALGLSWADIDLERSPATLTIRRGLLKDERGALYLDEPKTPGSKRTIHLPASAAEVLRRRRIQQAEERLAFGKDWGGRWAAEGLVFTNSVGGAVDPDKMNRQLQALTDEAGIGHWTPHELRHTAASLLLNAGVPLKSVSEMLGHSSIRVTADVYGHLLEPARAEVAVAMERVLGA